MASLPGRRACPGSALRQQSSRATNGLIWLPVPGLINPESRPVAPPTLSDLDFISSALSPSISINDTEEEIWQGFISPAGSWITKVLEVYVSPYSHLMPFLHSRMSKPAAPRKVINPPDAPETGCWICSQLSVFPARLIPEKMSKNSGACRFLIEGPLTSPWSPLSLNSQLHQRVRPQISTPKLFFKYKIH